VKGSNLQKAARLAGNLALHPSYLARYVAHQVGPRRRPLDLEIPWFSYAAIDFLDDRLRTHLTVFEYGSGGSTLFFAKRARSVLAVEDNPSWYDLVTRRVQERGFPNVEVELHPFDFKSAEGFERSAYLLAMPDRKFDVIVVDGSEEWTQVRPTCFQLAERHVSPGGMIVLDDSWRYESVRASHKAKRLEVFQSVGPGRPGVTSTDVYFY
jgi:SAM-dependent methyltransferase